MGQNKIKIEEKIREIHNLYYLKTICIYDNGDDYYLRQVKPKMAKKLKYFDQKINLLFINWK
jgi:hypothetical protein